tara:strand:- start:604 stop:906 length:303 start_codon:yes stop_codon:yes gene_type:complete
MDNSSVIFQGRFEGQLGFREDIVLIRERHARYGLDEWTVLRLENGEPIKKDTWGSPSMALRYFADKCKFLCDKYTSDYYEGKFLPALDEIFDLHLTKRLD